MYFTSLIFLKLKISTAIRLLNNLALLIIANKNNKNNKIVNNCNYNSNQIIKKLFKSQIF